MKVKPQPPTASRRELLSVTAVTAVSVPLASTSVATDAAATKGRGNSQETLVVNAGNTVALAKTTNGPVRGYTDSGIYTYKGIPYGAPPTGDMRFKPPVRPAAWSEPRPCMTYGPVSPQRNDPAPHSDEISWFMQWDNGSQDEDCLRLNVWTPGLDDGAGRPVMVWLHGGGFSNGSSQELPAYDGRNLADRGDVVVVSINHRLNFLGFTDLSEIDPAYASSGNAGMLDVVLALQWVRDNAALFGGDPGRVTVFGQSGGGGKVLALMAMPAAKGLFHRAIVQSGAYREFSTQAQARERTRKLISKLGLGSNPIQGLLAISAHDLIEQGLAGETRTGFGFTPIINNVDLASYPLPAEPGPYLADIPLLIGTNLQEFGGSMMDARREAMTREEAIGELERSYKGRGAALYDAVAKLQPGAKPIAIVSTVHPVRLDTINVAERMSQRASSPVYNYLFTYQTPVLDGRPRACHCAELPFVFNNTDRWSHMTGGGSVARRLGEQMSDSWVAFARTGNPNTRGLAFWPEFRADQRVTMLFDLKPLVRMDYDHEVLKIMAGQDVG